MGARNPNNLKVRIRKLLATEGPMTSGDIANKLEPPSTKMVVSNSIQVLRNWGIVTEVGKGKSIKGGPSPKIWGIGEGHDEYN
jgi:predicted transcriptional regulator